MNRAERRKAERDARVEEIEAMKKKKREDASKQKLIDETRAFDVDMLMTCFALAEHQLHGFGKKRISKSIAKVTELMVDILNDRATLDEYKEELASDAKVLLEARVS